MRKAVLRTAFTWALVSGAAWAKPPVAPAAAPPPQPGYRLKYALDVDFSTRMDMANQKREEAIAQLKQLLPRFDEKSPEKPDLYFQLAEYHWEQFRYLYGKEERDFETRLAEWQGQPEGKRGPEPKRDHREAEKVRSETLRLYELILKQYPKYPRGDEVLFALAFNLQETGKADTAVKHYEELLSRFPSSRFVPDSLVQLGDYWFDHNNLAKAQSYFDRAYRRDVPKIRSYALYKLAWCDYNDGRIEDALKKLQQVIDFAEKHGDQMVDLRNEALRDCVTAFVQLGRPDDAIQYFRQKAPPERQTKLIVRLAQALYDAGQHESAIKTYKVLLAADPTRPDAPEFQQAIVRGYEGLRQRSQVRAEVQKLADLYRPGSPWWKANEKDKSVLRNAFSVAEESLRVLVTDYHQEAQKTQQVETYRLARDIYKKYVDAFGSNNDDAYVSDYAFNLRYYYAEILWALEDWKAAAREYDAVVQAKIPDRSEAKEIANAEYRKMAAYNAILAYDKLLRIDRGELAESHLKEGQKVSEKKAKGGVESAKTVAKSASADNKPKPLTENERGMVAACDAFSQVSAGHKEEIDIRYQAAVIFYDKNHADEAMKRFAEIIERWPGEKRAQQAADSTLYMLESTGQWQKLSQTAHKFMENKALLKQDPEFSKRLLSVAEGSRYKWIDEELYKKNKDSVKAAEQLLKLVDDYPHGKVADRALTYAMVMLDEAKKVPRALSVGERMLKDYPNSPFELKVRRNMARLYERSGDYLKAAQMYDAAVASYDRVLAADAKKRKPEASAPEAEAERADEAESEKLLEEARKWIPDAQFNAALWYEALGNTDRAVAGFRRYVARFTERNDVPWVALKAASALDKAGRSAEAISAYSDFEAKYGKDERVDPADRLLAMARQVNLLNAVKKEREAAAVGQQATRVYSQLSDERKKEIPVRRAYAQSRFWSMEPSWNRYVAIRLQKVAKLRADLAAKQKSLQELEKGYLEVLSTGDGEWGIAALTRIGAAYADLSQNILESPVPKGLDADQTELYQNELKQLAMPLEDKAVDALEKGLAKAFELSVYTDWVLQAQELVNRYRPNTYPPLPALSLGGTEMLAAEKPSPWRGPVAAAGN